MASTRILDLLFWVGFLCSANTINGQGPTGVLDPDADYTDYLDPEDAYYAGYVDPQDGDQTVEPEDAADHVPSVTQRKQGRGFFGVKVPLDADHVQSVIEQNGTVEPLYDRSVQRKQGRGFSGIVNVDLVRVDVATADTLKSSLTTIFLPIIYIIVFTVGLPTNAMAIWVFLFRTKKKHPSSIYMVNLALSDLLFVIWTPLKIAYHINGNNWIYGEGLCKVLIGFFYGNMYCSILFIACLSVQRYWVVAHPLSQQRRNSKVAIGISVSIWAFIWLTTTPLYLYEHTAKLQDLDITTCHDVTIINNENNPFPSIQYAFYYFVIMAGLAFLVPSIVIVVAYVLLLRALGDVIADGDSGKKRRKAVILIVTVLVTFLVCFLPSNVMLVIHYFLLKDGVEDNGYRIYIISLCLASLNSCLDPIIYYYVSEDFRNHVKNTLLCRSNRTVERMKVPFSSMTYSKKSKSYVSESGNTQSSTC